MIECSECETARFLQIIRSETFQNDDGTLEYSEEYQCTSCGATGETHEDEYGIDVYGSIRDTTDLPNVRA